MHTPTNCYLVSLAVADLLVLVAAVPQVGTMPEEASFFDAMFGVKKLTNFIHAITCPTPAYEASVKASAKNRDKNSY